ncbi:MAG TPA: hypothetical protein VMM84_04430 [Pyrinomonadaceae bacterium]|nr:hypothetical protein [Pyrinomonadaceae bacterium]
MYTKPKIFPLDPSGTIYAVEDENGRSVGTGSREVCEVLLYLITKSALRSKQSSTENNGPLSHNENVRAAISI